MRWPQLKPVCGACAIRNRPTCVGPAAMPRSSGANALRSEMSPSPRSTGARTRRSRDDPRQAPDAGSVGKRRNATIPVTVTTTVAIDLRKHDARDGFREPELNTDRDLQADAAPSRSTETTPAGRTGRAGAGPSWRRSPGPGRAEAPTRSQAESRAPPPRRSSPPGVRARAAPAPRARRPRASARVRGGRAGAAGPSPPRRRSGSRTSSASPRRSGRGGTGRNQWPPTRSRRARSRRG